MCRIRNHVRLRYKEQDGKCIYCGIQMFLTEHKSELGFTGIGMRQATFDHKTPAANGGTYRLTNCVAACKLCNGVRGTIAFNTFKKTWAAHHEIWKQRQAKKVKIGVRRERNQAMNGFLIARCAWQMNITVEQLWDIYYTQHHKQALTHVGDDFKVYEKEKATATS